MGFDDPRFREIFYDLYAWLPRAGPGDDESTERALGLCEDLPVAPHALDVGCGPGRQTLVLARRCARALNSARTRSTASPKISAHTLNSSRPFRPG